MPLTAREVIKLLCKDGWECRVASGSHYKLFKEGKRSVVVPYHGKKTLGNGLVREILKQAGIDKHAVLRKDQKAKRR